LQSGVTHDDFNVTLHCFEVATPLLLMPGWTALGTIGSKAVVALDRRQYAAMAQPGDKFMKFNASVDQLNKAQRERLKIKPVRAKAANKVTPLADQPAEMLAAEVPTAVLIAALESRLSTLVKGNKLTPDALPKPIWSKLSDIAHMNDAVQDSEAFRNYQEHGISGDAVVVPATNDKQSNAA
jgi:hypothetical protein